jgi:hypothetical protein
MIILTQIQIQLNHSLRTSHGTHRKYIEDIYTVYIDRIISMQLTG